MPVGVKESDGPTSSPVGCVVPLLLLAQQSLIVLSSLQLVVVLCNPCMLLVAIVAIVAIVAVEDL